MRNGRGSKSSETGNALGMSRDKEVRYLEREIAASNGTAVWRDQNAMYDYKWGGVLSFRQRGIKAGRKKGKDRI